MMGGKACRVRYTDLEGIVHTVDVVAESFYEASVLALPALSKHEWVENVGPGTKLEIQIIDVTHTLFVAQLRTWMSQPARSPADVIKKKKLKDLLAS